MEEDYDPELERRHQPPGFYPQLVHRFRKRDSWEDRVAHVLHIVRVHLQVMDHDDDSADGSPGDPTRFCRFNLAFFDLDKESRPLRGRPLLNLPSYEHSDLEESVNVVSLKVIESDVGYPVRLFGTVLARNQIDYKCVYIFRRGRDDAQLISSPEDSLTMTDPCRGLAVTSSMFFEIDLKIKADDAGDDDRVFSKGVIVHDTCTVREGQRLVTKRLYSRRSTLQLAFTHVPSAVQATLTVTVLDGSRGYFNGQVVAWTSRNKNKILLHDGTIGDDDDDGSVALSRRLVAVPVDERLVLRVCVRDDGDEAACFQFTLGHIDDRRTIYKEECAVRVKVEWTAILNSMRRNVFRYVEKTTCSPNLNTS